MQDKIYTNVADSLCAHKNKSLHTQTAYLRKIMPRTQSMTSHRIKSNDFNVGFFYQRFFAWLVPAAKLPLFVHNLKSINYERREQKNKKKKPQSNAMGNVLAKIAQDERAQASTSLSSPPSNPRTNNNHFCDDDQIKFFLFSFESFY